MHKFIGPAIIIFWLVMTVLLIKQEILPSLPALSQPSYEAVLKNRQILGRSLMGIYLFNQNVGYSMTSITSDSKGFYHFKNETIIKLASYSSRLALPIDMKMNGESLINPDYQLVSFDFTVEFGMNRYQTTGKVLDKYIEVNIDDGKNIRNERVPFDSKMTISNGLSPFISMPNLTVGKEWIITMFDPITRQITPVKAYVESKDTMEWRGKEYEVYEVVLDYKGFKPRAYITPDGKILKEEILFPGCYLIREEITGDKNTLDNWQKVK